MSSAEKIAQIETLLQQGKKAEAISTYQKLMTSAGNDYGLWVNYASFLHRCGQFEQAIAIAEKSITIKPSAEGYHNLACALRDSGKTGDAIIALKKAIHLNPDFFKSHAELGHLLMGTGELIPAIDHFQIATALAPQFSSYWLGLARARLAGGRHRETLAALRFARKVDPNNSVLWTLYSQFFKTCTETLDISPLLFDEVQKCISMPTVNPEHLTATAQMLFLHQNVIKSVLSRSEHYRIKDFPSAAKDKNFNWSALCHPAFTGMLSRIILQNEDIETALTTLRFHLLDTFTNNRPERETLAPLKPFMAALACQCFINEYVFFESDEEKNLLSNLEKNLDETDPILLCIYACYRPLASLKNAPQILRKHDADAAMKDLLKLQITEPLEEDDIKKSIPQITSIDDSISKLVKAQYEINPYPRWTHTATAQTFTLQQTMMHLFPHLKEDHFKSINTENPRTLIAGCGTGKQPIEVAQRFSGSDILAVDLSAASIAYAMRKTREYDIKKIEYGLADILKLNELKEQFDVIQCGGVLHHMDDPMAGWRVLTDRLKPGGFMMIALYSELARRSIVAAREFIKSNGYKSDENGIRACREDIKLLPPHHPVKTVCGWMDFYSTSACRDLIFHVQEHRYTVPMLKKSIAELGLEFLGFQILDNAVMKHYKTMFPGDAHGTSLDNWDTFEQKNPDTFEAMYQFWLRKPD